MNLHCPLQDQCSGCDLLHLDSMNQKSQKIETFRTSLGRTDISIEYNSISKTAERSRLDFILSDGKMGLYQKGSRDVVDIETCLQLEPRLQNFYEEFRKIHWPIKKGSVRLRVSPDGQKGAWLDFSNEEIKELLDSEKSLLALQEISFVEIGQRHKSLIRKQTGPLGLGEPVYKNWFQTWMLDQPIPLFSTVASFTQPSHSANKMITQNISKWFQKLNPRHVLEFGAGIGNLTFPALSGSDTHVTATDIDERALTGLGLSLKNSNLENRVDIQVGDFRIKSPQIKEVDVLLLNPARNGVGKFLSQLLPLGPQHILYISCFPKSFFEDIQILKDYSLEKVQLMDQFPNTTHVEVLAEFKKI